MTLGEVLRARGLHGAAARDALRHGKVRLHGVPVADPGREAEPDAVELRPDAPRTTVGRDPVVLWRDDALVVVWKPAGMLSVPAPRRHDESVVPWVARRLGQGLAVHRLDEDTSGVMLVARTPAAQEAMKARFEAHVVERVYTAVARGALRGPVTVRNTLVRDRGDSRRGSGPGGKPAVTHLRPLAALRAATLVEARLETGRTHQVRIHLAELGHPLLGDPLYGDGRGAPRLALHATVLGFVHPTSGAALRWEVPLPDDLDALVRRLRPPEPARRAPG